MARRDDDPVDLGPNHPDSIASNESDSKHSEKKKSKRPANTAFRQQRLKAWQDAPTTSFASMPPENVEMQFKSSGNGSNKASAMWMRKTVTVAYDGVPVPGNVQQCSLQFDIPDDMGPPVLFYYHLTNFYQNHRRYVNSFYDKQLKGDVFDSGSVHDSNCDPLRLNATGAPYYPCGLIANSLFNDTFTNPVLLNVQDGSNDNETYVMQSKNNIAWSSDKALYGNFPASMNYSDVAPPPNWINRYPHGYTETNPPPNFAEDEPFMVWMRTAGLPTFSKLAQRNDTAPMHRGTYQIDILHFFPVDEFHGTKSIIISTRTVMGGRNNFLGIAYLVVGGICVFLGVVFTVTHMVKPRKLGDHTYLSWNNAPSASRQVAATGAGSASVMASGRDLSGSGA
ncbi:lem3 cdc50 family protein [Niveomyces insectorum RCEF 264]|uniref:Lem3 cdc50 family protein n=1 Tax=Niveomyces insectorum RCEF 264 TaxID=1081102 RepID=A0A167LQL5_9HYPO|nr:lem3 cdc50 family protein [Niveomyces insectorum RCEF 264]